MEKTKVTIVCTTYNHVAYIKEALDSFLMQKTNFNYNIFIFDDASTDGTSDIVREYQKKYPNIIYAYISPVNTYGKVGRKKLIFDLWEEYLTGEYIAMCEGDDAWTCEDKLQIQVDFLDKNADCIMTTHAFKWIDCLKNEVESRHLCSENRYMLPEEVILRLPCPMATASLVMRREVFFGRMNEALECDIGDVPMQFYAIYHGRIYYFDKEMSVYRIMHEGSWNRTQADDPEKHTHHCLGFIDFLIRYNAYTKGLFERFVWKQMLAYLHEIVGLLCKVNDAETFIKSIPEKNNHAYDSFLEEIIPVYNWMSGRYEMDSQTREMMSQYEHICIMGKGNYSKFIVNGLEKNGVKYDGYLLSKKEENCRDSNVWDVSDFPYNKETTLVIVGINQGQEEIITGTLKKHGFKNVWCPLWFNKENIWE